MYKFTHEPNQVLRLTDGAFVPFAPGNRDYAEYKKWLGEGNTPLPPDPLPDVNPDDYVDMRRLVRYLKRTRQALVAAGINGLPNINELFE
jgi:hypothetical protein